MKNEQDPPAEFELVASLNKIFSSSSFQKLILWQVH